MARNGWGGIDGTAAATAALDALELKGWLRLRHVEARGARPHVLYELHPNPSAAPEASTASGCSPLAIRTEPLSPVEVPQPEAATEESEILI